uniref:uncharacterized protein LOC122610564 n=1 Tax=Erigeron canadensis TaxID=72917 RepID=UPI001CB955B1|nr:uncharacterized protein LOC122610564 [Erigeron canadensis]
MRVVPKVWKRLVTTFLSMFLCIFNYALLSSVVFFLWSAVFWETYLNIGFLALDFLYCLIFIDLAIYWQIASVISVLENGPQDVIMTKANNLMKGKKKVALRISAIMYLFFAGIVLMYMVFVFDDGPKMVLVWKIMIGIMCFVLLMITLLLMMVVQTMLYLVCKAHHGEVVDPVSLSTYLGAYLSDSQPPVFRVGEVIQLGRPQNRPTSQV